MPVCGFARIAGSNTMSPRSKAPSWPVGRLSTCLPSLRTPLSPLHRPQCRHMHPVGTTPNLAIRKPVVVVVIIAAQVQRNMLTMCPKEILKIIRPSRPQTAPVHNLRVPNASHGSESVTGKVPRRLISQRDMLILRPSIA